MIVVDLSKQPALEVDTKTIQQINFTANLDRTENTRIYFILKEAKETVLDFSHETVKVLWMQLRWMQFQWMQFHWIQFYWII